MDGKRPESASWRPFQGPFQRFPRTFDFLLAALALWLSLVMWMPIGDIQSLQQPGWPWVVTFLLMLGGNSALYWRRRHPVRVHLLIVLCSAAVLLIGESSSALFGMVFSLYSLGRYAADERASLVGMVLSVLLASIDLFLLQTPNIGSVVALLVVFGLWYVGRRLRFRGEYLRLLEERAEHLERERAVEAAQAVAAERTRIARELHDIVAHQVSLMTIQAAAAKTVARDQPDAAATAMGAVERAGRQALDELRHVLGVLRPASPDTALDPQPGSADLPRLIAGLQETGLDVELTIRGLEMELPARVDLAIYRVVQESLTNVLKHAGSRASACVTVHGEPQGVTVEVVDNGAAVGPGPGSGHGITGMRERVQLLGGTLEAGTLHSGGFSVRAHLPIRRLGQ